MIRSVSVLGCGWLGFPAAKFLLSKRISVKGSTTHNDKLELLKNAGIEPFKISLDPELKGDKLDDFFSSELLIVNIPPSISKTSEEFHVLQMRELMNRIENSPVKYLIYISSTSVYPDNGKEMTEDDVMSQEKAANITLFRAEEIFRNNKGINSLILRCAGLAGYDRNIAKYFAGKRNLKMGNAPVNLIHRDDVIEIIFRLIEKDIWNKTHNLSAPQHPLRKDLYPYLAKAFNLSLPEYDLSDSAPGKIINGARLRQDLNYIFKFPDPAKFFYS